MAAGGAKKICSQGNYVPDLRDHQCSILLWSRISRAPSSKGSTSFRKTLNLYNETNDKITHETSLNKLFPQNFH
jgi:hypothetical protein